MRRLRRSLAGTLIIALVALFTGGAVQGASRQPDDLVSAVKLLTQYKVVAGDPNGGLRLYDPITRAEMAKVLVAAMKKEHLALFFGNLQVFPDVTGHWASGYVTGVHNLGLMGGYPDGMFQPENRVTHAEAAVIMLRALGREAEGGSDWPRGPLAAVQRLGLTPVGADWRERASTPILRGDLFHLLARTWTLSQGDSKSLATKYWDTEAPQLTLSPLPAEVRTPEVTVQGRVAEAATVTVAGKSVTPDTSGGFSTTVQLQDGQNDLQVVAEDQVGNRAEKGFQVTYRAKRVSRLEIKPRNPQVNLGESISLSARAIDEQGNEMSNVNMIWSVDPAKAKFDAASGRLTTLATGEIPVTVTADGKSDRTTIAVPGQAARLAITPSRTVVAANGVSTVDLAIEVRDITGRRVPGASVPVVLSNGAGAVGRLDRTAVQTVDGQATVRLSSAGESVTGAVTVTASTAAGVTPLASASTVVTFESRRISGVLLQAQPDVMPFQYGRTVPVSATVVDQDKVAMPANMPVDVRLTSADTKVATVASGVLTIPYARKDTSGSGHGSIQITGRGTTTIGATASAGGVNLQVYAAEFAVKDVGPLARLQVDAGSGVVADGVSPISISVRRVDSNGVLNGTDPSIVTLTSNRSDVIISLISDTGGVAEFEARSSVAGSVTFTATAVGRSDIPVTSVSANFTESVTTSGWRIVLESTYSSIAADGATGSTIKATLKDGAGNSIVADQDLVLTLSTGSRMGTMVDSSITIPQGSAIATDTAWFQAGVEPGPAYISGRVTRGRTDIPVVSANLYLLSISSSSGSSGSSGSSSSGGSTNGPGYWQFITGSAGNLTSGQTAQFKLQVVDNLGNFDLGSHAFQVQVSVDGTPVTTPPDGMTVYLNGTSVNALYDGITEGASNDTNDAIVKTVNGEATIDVTWTGAGTITLKPVAAAATNNIQGPGGVIGNGASTSGFRVSEGRAVFKPASANRLSLAITPNLGGDSAAYVGNIQGRLAQVLVRLEDQYGNVVADPDVTFTITRTGGGGVTAVNGASSASGQNGYYTFGISVQTPTSGVTDTYEIVATGSGVAAGTVTVTTVSGTPGKPTIQSLAGSPSGELAKVKATDTDLQIGIAALGITPVKVLVYVGGSKVKEVGPVDLSADAVISVPRSVLPNGTNSLQIVIDNGYQTGPASDARTITVYN